MTRRHSGPFSCVSLCGGDTQAPFCPSVSFLSLVLFFNAVNHQSKAFILSLCDTFSLTSTGQRSMPSLFRKPNVPAEEQLHAINITA